GMETVRGPLARPSVRLQTVPLRGDAEKLAWLARWVPSLRKQSGHAGIVYALTQRWTERIAEWLRKAGLDARAYHAGLGVDEKLDSERDLMEDKLDCLVATTALGMGYDKRDLGFVVHFHQPASVVHYYQQVGRAGRAIPTAYGVMLSGGDDRAITDWFIDEAFPPEQRVAEILSALERSGAGLNPRELEQACNLRRGQIERALKILAAEEPAPVALAEGKWRKAAPYDPARRKALAEKMTGLRKAEQRQMDAYSRHAGCFMEFLARALDDPHAGPCGACAVCRGMPDAMRAVQPGEAAEAGLFLRGGEIVLEPRKQWPAGALASWKGNIAAGLRAEEGRALCVLGDGGWGEPVAQAIERGAFNAELADALAALAKRWNPQPAPEWVACVPSLRRPEMVDGLARAVAHRLGLPFRRVLYKVRENRPQAEMENSFQQASNLDGVFASEKCAGPVLLIDDMADSGWTLTAAAAVLRQAGAGPVFPIVMATAT
ncbi:MAG: hypothetical protein K2W96_19885, partial [Gemmataceae bacterium]|nr:hypothetical protein [Gemmataceae bacterium]